MTVETVQSDFVLNLDQIYGQMVTPLPAGGTVQPNPGSAQGANPNSMRQTAGGAGSGAVLQTVQGFLTPTNGATSNSWYPMVRVPTSALIRKVEVVTIKGTLTTFTGDITVAFSDAFDGTNFANQELGPPSGLAGTAPGNALIVNPAATSTGLTGTAAFFAQGFAFASASSGVWTDVTFLNQGGFAALGSNGHPLNMNAPLWQALGFLSDPRGYLDLGVLTTANNSLTSSGVSIGMRCWYVNNQR